MKNWLAFAVENVTVYILAIAFFIMARSEGKDIVESITFAFLWIVVGFLQIIVGQLYLLTRRAK